MNKVNKIFCKICKQRHIQLKKWELCTKCYNKVYQLGGTVPMQFSPISADDCTRHTKEIKFIKNYFKGSTDWLYEPVTFKIIKFGKYTPDFYDMKRFVFLEIAGTRRAYSANRKKYLEFKKIYPNIDLEVYTSDGTLVDFNKRRQPDGTWDYNRK